MKIIQELIVLFLFVLTTVHKMENATIKTNVFAMKVLLLQIVLKKLAKSFAKTMDLVSMGLAIALIILLVPIVNTKLVRILVQIMEIVILENVSVAKVIKVRIVLKSYVLKIAIYVANA